MRSKALAVRYLAMAVAFGLMLLSAGSIAPVAFGEPGGGATLPLLMKGHARADANAAGRPGAPTWDPQSAVRAMNGDPWAVPDRPVAGPRPATPARRAALATGTPLLPGQEHVGWRDEEFAYLIPGAAYHLVARYCREEGSVFPVKERTLWKELAREKVILHSNGRYQELLRVDGAPRRVLRVPWHLLETEGDENKESTQ